MKGKIVSSKVRLIDPLKINFDEIIRIILSCRCLIYLFPPDPPKIVPQNLVNINNLLSNCDSLDFRRRGGVVNIFVDHFHNCGKN